MYVSWQDQMRGIIELCFIRSARASEKCAHRCSIVVSISACHAGDPGSIPGVGESLLSPTTRESPAESLLHRTEVPLKEVWVQTDRTENNIFSRTYARTKVSGRLYALALCSFKCLPS